MVIGKPLPSLVFADQSFQLVSISTATFASLSLSTAAADRAIVVVAGFTNSSALTAVTVGGVSATPVVQATDGSSQRSEIWIAQVPTGTTGTVVLSSSTGFGAAGVGIFAAYNLTSIVPTDTNSDTVGTLNMNANVSANGVVVAGAMANSAGSAGSPSWTVPSLAYQGGNTNFNHSGATYTATSAVTPLTITCSGLGGFIVGTAASFA